jgi:predicted metal-dependent hydrolase
MRPRSQLRTFTFGTSTIEYELRRSPRRVKTIEITVDPVDGVRVAAPATASLQRVDMLIRRRAPWILRRLADGANGALLPPKRDFVTGESLDYLGRQYRLRVDRDGASTVGTVRLTRGWFEVHLPRAASASGKASIVRLLERWYKTHADRKIRQRVALYAARLGVQPARVLVKSQERRWGSCGRDNTLRFNWRIIMAPLSIVDYVVVHELCHLRHSNHGSAFWDSVASVFPDYQQRRERLRREGTRYRL